MSKNGTATRLTPEQKKAYVEKGGQYCPYCGSTNIEGGRFDAEWKEAWSEVSCADCDRTWTDEYLLVNVTETGEE